MRAHEPKALVRPLRIRPGARYRCAGDGLCCTDAHALGPLTGTEVRALKKIKPKATERHPILRVPVLRVLGGNCVFLNAGGCAIHAEKGLPQPAACRRFPLGLVATPSGGRVTTAHRCPCRSMGHAPLLAEEDAAALILGGRLQSDATVTTVGGNEREPMRWSAYEAIEAEILAGLERGADLGAVFPEAPFPALSGIGWTDVGHLFRSHRDGSAGGDALVAFGESLLSLTGHAAGGAARRPWAPSFDQAEARSDARDPDALLRDFLSDELWSLAWTERGDMRKAFADLRTRARAAEAFADRLRRDGVRGDRAMAEGILVAEIAGASDLWAKIVRQFRSPRRR